MSQRIEFLAPQKRICAALFLQCKDLPPARISRYNAPVPDNTFDIESVCQIESLAKSLGGLKECKRLGFIYEDGQGVMSLSVAGLGYLLFVKATGVTSLAEAFAAGYQCAHEENE